MDENRLNTDDMFRVGVITEPHGIKGEVKVYPTTDDPMRLGKLNEIYMMDKEPVLLHPVSARAQKNLLIMSFKEFKSRNDVEGLRKKELYVTRENAVPLEEGEYYISDLCSLKAIDEDGKELGDVTEVYRTGANDVYEITKPDGKTLLLPAIPQCILDINIDEGFMKVHVMEGLE